MKQAMTFAGGDRPKQPILRPENKYEGGDRPKQPIVRPEIKLPESKNRMMSAEGVRGFNDDTSPASRPLGSLSYCQNLYRFNRTAARTRPGRTTIGRIGNGWTTGMAPLYKSTGEAYLVAGVSNGDISAWDGTSWRRVGGGWNSHFCAAMFGDMMIICTGAAEPVLKWDAVSFGGYNVFLGGTPPHGAKYITTAYKSVFLAGMDTEPHMLYASDAGTAERWVDNIDANGYPDNGDATAIPVNDMDGDRITWLTTYRQNVLIFKRHSIHELYGPELGQVSNYWRVIQAGNRGTPNGRTVVEIDTVMYWLSDEGIVAWGGGKQAIISDPVRNTFRRINWAAIDKAAAGHDNEGRYILSVPIDGAAMPNCTLVYDTRDNSWWTWDGADTTAYSQYRINGAETLFFGNGTGYGYKVGGDTDDGADIRWEGHFGPSTGGLNYRDKLMRRAYFITSVDSGTLQASLSVSDTAAFGAVISLAATGATNRIKRTVPIAGSEETETFAPTIRLVGRGVVIIHDVGLEWTERDV